MVLMLQPLVLFIIYDCKHVPRQNLILSRNVYISNSNQVANRLNQVWLGCITKKSKQSRNSPLRKVTAVASQECLQHSRPINPWHLMPHTARSNYHFPINTMKVFSWSIKRRPGRAYERGILQASPEFPWLLHKILAEPSSPMKFLIVSNKTPSPPWFRAVGFYR